MLVLLVEFIFLTTFYGLYFNHKLHVTLIILIEKFSPLPGFERRTSTVPSRYATNWAILAWITSFFLFSDEKRRKTIQIKEKCLKTALQFWPALGCGQHQKAGRNTQHSPVKIWRQTNNSFLFDDTKAWELIIDCSVT